MTKKRPKNSILYRLVQEPNGLGYQIECFQCSDGVKIPWYGKCDGGARYDCADRGDESTTNPLTRCGM